MQGRDVNTDDSPQDFSAYALVSPLTASPDALSPQLEIDTDTNAPRRYVGEG
jgi:hypothetical protein